MGGIADLFLQEIIRNMEWSYSRVNSFEDCPYGWYLRYISKVEGGRQFFSDFGKLIHEILERFYKGELEKEDMLLEFLTRYETDVQGVKPPDNVVLGYLRGGLEYLRSFEPLPYKCVGVEIKLDFYIHGHKFVGLVDYVGEDENGDYVIVDHKSRKLYPRSGRKTPTINDKTIDEMIDQLYVYAYGIKEIYGKYPKELIFNCYRTKSLIREPFDEEKCHKVIENIGKSIGKIILVDDFYPRGDFFYCKYLCGVTAECDYAENFIKGD